MVVTCKSQYGTNSLSASIGCGQIMGWGEKAIEVRSVETGLLDGVFMHKRAQTFRFLCERNEKVRLFHSLYCLLYLLLVVTSL